MATSTRRKQVSTEPASRDLAAVVPNPYREGQLGYWPWKKGWRPVAAGDGQIAIEWQHPNWPTTLPLYEIWERIVFQRWGVVLKPDTTEVRRLAALPVRLPKKAKLAPVADDLPANDAGDWSVDGADRR